MTGARDRINAIAEDVRAWVARHRRVVLVVSVVAFIAFAWFQATKQARLQQPKLFPDSTVYLQTALQPLSTEHLFFPKPITVPAAYHFLGADPASIATFQLRFATVAWTLFGLALCASLYRTRARVVAIAITFVFLLAPYRIGFASAILSESITDSLTTLMITLGLVLALAARLPLGRTRTIVCWSITAVLVVTTTAWLLARDSNAISAIAAIAIAAALWRLHRTWRDARWAVVLVAAVAIASGFAMWTTRVGPTPPTKLTLHDHCSPAFFPRTAFPTANNVILRVLPDAEAKAFFVERGLPQVDELAALTWEPPELRFFEGPELAPARNWIAEHGSSVYMRWLLAHPLDRADELARQLWDVLASEDLVIYMPLGWISSYGFPGWTVRRATTSELLLFALLLAAPFALRRPTRHVATAVALVLIGSGVFGAAAAYYGDAFEVSRHMFGAGQQIVLGLFLAPLVWLDQKRSAA